MRHPVLFRLILFSCLLQLGACTAQRFSSTPEETDFPVIDTHGEDGALDTAQIQRLFSDVTAYGWRLSDETELRRYYSAEGHVIDLHPVHGRREGRWTSGNDQLCISWDGQRECAVIKRKNNRIGQYQESTTWAPRKTISYERFLRGNPEYLE